MKKTLCAMIALGLGATAALADYPEKPVEVIVGYSAGGGTDVMARTVSQFLEQELGDGASVVVKNMPGAGGQIGFTEVAGADADGYTLGTFNLPAALALTHDREADYDVTSFTYLANFVEDPNTITVAASSPYQTLDELLAAAKADPRAITVGLSSLGGNDHFAANMMATASGVEFTIVPFKGASNARTAIMGGHVAWAARGVKFRRVRASRAADRRARAARERPRGQWRGTGTARRHGRFAPARVRHVR